jgi:hypothetical protein
MTLRIRTVDDQPFRWEWEGDPDVWIEMLPVTPRVTQNASRSAAVTISPGGGVGIAGVLDMAVEQAKQVFLKWGGIELDGGPIPCTHKNIELVAQNYPSVLQEAIVAGGAEYQRRLEARMELEGN